MEEEKIMYNQQVREAKSKMQEKGMHVDSYVTLNEVLVNLFRDVLEIEEKSLATSHFRDLTNNDMHVIEAIGIEEPKNMSAIAKLLSVTVGTLTIAMNSLVKKGYVTRERGKTDRRVVFISLSEKGRAAYEHHAAFHQEMIQSIAEQLTKDELDALTKALTCLNQWFREKEKIRRNE